MCLIEPEGHSVESLDSHNRRSLSVATDNISLGSAIAGGAIATSLIEVLFEKGSLTLDEVRTVIDRAVKLVAPMPATTRPAPQRPFKLA
jgi:hypothetical protein